MSGGHSAPARVQAPAEHNRLVFLQLSFDLGQLDAEAAAEAANDCGASAVTFVDAGDKPVLEPAPGEVRLWPATRVRCLFAEHSDRSALVESLGVAVGVDPSRIEVEEIGDRAWEREWLRDFRPLRFGRRLWVRPHHEVVTDPEAVVVALDPGLAFGTGTHESTAQCLAWLDAHFSGSPAPAEHFVGSGSQGLDAHFSGSPAPAEHFVGSGSQGLDAHFPESPMAAEHFVARRADGLDAHFPDSPALVIDYGCGSGILGLAAAKLGAAAVHAHDIDPQALIATHDNAVANGVAGKLHLHESAATLPIGVDVLLANILSGPLCALAERFATLVRPGGSVVLAGLMQSEAADVTGAYAAWFDVTRFAERDGWVCLSGRRRAPNDSAA